MYFCSVTLTLLHDPLSKELYVSFLNFLNMLPIPKEELFSYLFIMLDSVFLFTVNSTVPAFNRAKIGLVLINMYAANVRICFAYKRNKAPAIPINWGLH